MTVSITGRAVLDAATAAFGNGYQFEVQPDRSRGGVSLFTVVNVDDTPTSLRSRTVSADHRSVSLADATEAGLHAEPGDELLFEIFYRSEDAERAASQASMLATLLGLRPTSDQLAAIADAAQNAYLRSMTTMHTQEGTAR